MVVGVVVDEAPAATTAEVGTGVEVGTAVGTGTPVAAADVAVDVWIVDEEAGPEAGCG